MVKIRDKRASVLEELLPVEDESIEQEPMSESVNDTVDTGNTLKNPAEKLSFTVATTPHTISKSKCKVSADTNLTPEKTSRPVKESDLLSFSNYDWPEPLKGITKLGRTQAQKDALLLSGITIMGGLLGRNLFCKYHTRYLFPNLQTYIAGPTGWDMERLFSLRKMCDGIEDSVREDYDKEYDRYLQSLQHYEEVVASQGRYAIARPDSPVMRRFILPGVQCGLDIKEGIINQGGQGLLLEMEAEPIGYAVEDDYYHWQDAMCKCFYNGRLSLSSRGGMGQLVDRCPTLSVLLSGTYETLQQLIPGIANCLFPMQLFYCMPKNTDYHGVYISQKDRDAMDAEAQRVYKVVKDVYSFVENENKRLDLHLHKEQCNKIRDTFSSLKKMAEQRYDGALNAVTDKLETNVMRIIMVVAALRSYRDERATIYSSYHPVYPPYSDKGVFAYEMQVSEEDLDACLELAVPLFYHSVHVAETMSEQLSKKKVKFTREDILAMMGDTFTQRELFALAKQYGIEKTTSKNWVRKSHTDIKLLGHGLVMKVDSKKNKK